MNASRCLSVLLVCLLTGAPSVGAKEKDKEDKEKKPVVEVPVPVPAPVPAPATPAPPAVQSGTGGGSSSSGLVKAITIGAVAAAVGIAVIAATSGGADDKKEEPGRAPASAPQAPAATNPPVAAPEAEPAQVLPDPPRPRPRPVYQELSLIVTDHGFVPRTLSVVQNVPVRLYVATTSRTAQCLVLTDWGIRRGVIPGQIEEILFLPRIEGKFRFSCPIKSASGTLAVEPSNIEAYFDRAPAGGL